MKKEDKQAERFHDVFPHSARAWLFLVVCFLAIFKFDMMMPITYTDDLDRIARLWWHEKETVTVVLS